MAESKSNKQKKTLHLPNWICDLLDKEGHLLGGKPGLVASAAVLMFSEASSGQKAQCLRRIHEQELTDAYNLADNTANSPQSVAQRIVRNADRPTNSNPIPEKLLDEVP